MEINAKLKFLRKQKGINQDEAAQLLGVSLSSYQKYEREKNSVTPSLEVLVKLADFYGVTTDYLLGREPAQPEPNPFADLGLDKESEQEMLAQYMSFPPETRAILMDALVQLASVVKPNEPETIRQSTMIDCGTVGEELERRARQKDTA